jgi:predicted transcriptional regulator
MATAQEIKQAAHQLIDSLPDDATWETLLYTLQVRHDIEAGVADAKAGRVYSTAEARSRLGIDNG